MALMMQKNHKGFFQPQTSVREVMVKEKGTPLSSFFPSVDPDVFIQHMERSASGVGKDMELSPRSHKMS